MSKVEIKTGGEFLVKDIDANDIFIPEEFEEEQQMILQTCYDFLDAEVIPNLDKIDKKENNIMRTLISKAGELGLLGIAVPEEYEGFNQSFLTTMYANEAIGSSFSYAVAYMAHTGIGTLPLLYYGNEKQKQKYIPRMASGEMAAAYCLTEPNAGSDANSGASRATLSEDGKHYILNGQKMWITNGGFADILTVFAKIDNDRVLSAFLVESDWEGVTVNPEEHKMGIKGSSTTQLFFSDVKVPVENLLGKRGEGFRIALNILHIGRIKLAANSLGSAKRTINYAVNYANERKQFGKHISSFGAIQHKLAEQVIRTYAAESSIYRASKQIDTAIAHYESEGLEHGAAHIEGSAQYAVECALLKVYGSEMLDYVVDEAVQIYGGMGFSADMPVDRAYRDSRINRIFEGTNEINRLLVVDTAIKDAQKNKYDLFGPAAEVMKEIENLKPVLDGSESYYEEKHKYVKAFKKAVLMAIYSMTDTLQRKLAFEQEIMMNVTDMMIQLYVAESTLLRVEKLETIKGAEAVKLQRDILDVVIYDAAAKIQKSGKDAIYSYAENNANVLIKALEHFTTVKGLNVKDNRRRIATHLIEENKYKF
ncbi:MAG: acyl-CoA dehydrogenase family protein [Bacteroidales bacterium]|nr:acyl-CoA dehydrogenase family protein [Bacteroidales bacterium]